MEVILFKKEDQGVGIIQNCSDDYTLEEIAVLDVPSGAEWRIIEEGKLPVDYTFRDAWIWKNGEVEICLERAKEIIRTRFRELRPSLFEKLDLEFMRAVESKNAEQQEAISAKKQALRDVTATELPDNLEELKTFVPEILQEAIKK